MCLIIENFLQGFTNDHAYRMSISLPRISRTAFPIAAICSSFLPAKLHPNQRNEFNDDRSAWKNAGSIRNFFDRSNTEIPSIFTWLNGLFRSAFEMVFIVFDASSKCMTQLHIFSVFNILEFKIGFIPYNFRSSET